MSGFPYNVVFSETLVGLQERAWQQAAYNAEIAAAAELERELEAAQASFPPLILAQFYKYEPLEDPYTSTRLLGIAPGREDDALRGSLQRLRLRDGQMIYKALSYVWGSPIFTESIFIDGKKLHITPNLAAALRHFRSSSKWLWLWVDQVCINQKDPAERSKQVRMMHSIYKDAEEVLAWLGPDVDKNAEKAFSLVHALRAILRDHLLSSLCKKAGAEFDWIPRSHWKSLKQLCEVNWFRRVWIPQEIGTNSRASIHWGSRNIDWEVFCDAMRRLDAFQELKRRHGIDSSSIVSLHRRFVAQHEDDAKQARGNFTYQLCLSAKSSASDPRDYVFSLLGHFSALLDGGIPIIQPDYDNSVSAIFHETAIRILMTSSTLTILNAVLDNQKTKSKSPDTTRLPSWVPRWDLRASHSLIGHPGRYNASYGKESVISFDEKFKYLTVRGLGIDSIKRILDKPFPVDSSSPAFKSHLQLAWSLCVGASNSSGQPPKNLRFTDNSKYDHDNGYDEPIEAFLNTLVPMQLIESLAPVVSGYKSGIATLEKLFPARKKEIRSLAAPEDELKSDSAVWIQAAEQHVCGRKFAITSTGYFVIVPSSTAKGDLLCILFGGETPYILKRSSDSTRHQLVGEAYAHGLMSGQSIEMAEAGKLSETNFEIC